MRTAVIRTAVIRTAVAVASVAVVLLLAGPGATGVQARPGLALPAQAGLPARAGFGSLPMIRAGAGSAPAAGRRRRDITSGASLNWAGYAVTRTQLRFTAVRATFFVPYLNCAKSPGSALSSEWVGLDGFTGRTDSVEQGGIAANCGAIGKAVYFAWWELFPGAQQKTTIKVSAGDSVTASVSYSAKGQEYKISITDHTNGRHFSVQRKCPHVEVAGRLLSCPRNSAEIIAEAPATGPKLKIARLADYGATSFGAISITDGRGAKGGIVSSRWNATKIIQLRASGGATLARPTPTAARTFDIYWLRAG
jgi:Peptidase A4 family